MPLNLEKKLPNHESQHVLGAVRYGTSLAVPTALPTSEKGRFPASRNPPPPQEWGFAKFLLAAVRRACACDIPLDRDAIQNSPE